MAAETPDHTVVIHVTPGELLDQRWRIETRVGQGAMGSVFKGRDLQANKPVAIKILAPEHCRKPKVVARFEREAEKMTSLRHPNIVSFHGHGRRGALPFIVMEFLEGLTLSDVIEQQGGKLPVADAVAIVKQIASGLAFLHHNGLVHRDIKPQNVFLCVGGRITILDLGVVRDQHNPGLTRPGAMVGTPYYMSPEQILGVEDIDKRTDIYALAAVTFELLTGRPPYLGNNNFEVLYGHKNTPPPDASQLVKGVSKPVAQVLMRGMAKRRDERPDTVMELVADLEAAAGARKVDLARLVGSAQPPAAVVEKTRLVPRLKVDKPAPPVPTIESVPEARNSDVVSVPGTALIAALDPNDTGQSGEQKTVLLRLESLPPSRDERTFIGPSPDAAPAATYNSSPSLPPPGMGQLRVVVTAKGKAVNAAVFVDGGRLGESPVTLTLSPGPHQVRIVLDGYREVERWATVAVGSPSNLRVFLEKEG